MKVCIGGTFDPLHKGHRALIDKAFELGTKVYIGLTSDKMAQSYRTLCVSPYEERKKRLEEYIEKRGFRAWRKIVVLENRFGPAVEEDFEAIVVSPETKPIADKLNKIRIVKGLNPLKIIIVPYVLAKDCFPISSTRIKNGEIDAEGRMLREVLINVGSANEIKINATKEVFSKFFEKICVKGFKLKSSVSSIPFNDKIVNGAINRAKNSIGQGDFGVGIEAGISWNKAIDKYFCLHYCAIVDKMGKITLGQGQGFEIPNEIIFKIKNMPLDKILKSLLKDNIDKGMIYYLSKGNIERKKIVFDAVFMAIVPRIRLCFL